jgi:carbon storage regulator CsrA
MLVLSRKTQEAVVIGGADGFHRLFKVKVLEIRGANVKLGFEVDPDVPVHRAEVWERILHATREEVERAKDRLDNTQATETTIHAEPVAVGV